MKEIEPIGFCYVLLQTGKIHPIAHERDKVIWYPERSMTLIDQIKYIPYIQSIVTESPWLISCYQRKNVRVWVSEFRDWAECSIETYGASVNGIMCNILGIYQTIPACVLDDGKEINKMLSTLDYGE